MSSVVAIILAGGKGTRLGELTTRMPKPAIPFAGRLRIIDFSLFNALNSGVDRVLVLTQYGHWELQRHVEQLGLSSVVHGKHVSVVPPHYYMGHGEYLHTANAVFQNVDHLCECGAENVLILSGDHVYKMDYRHMLAHHLDTGADFTICTMDVGPEDARQFGIIEVGGDMQVTAFVEKPKSPKLDGRGMCRASMGIYVAKREFLVRALTEDHASTVSQHDFGGDVIPRLIADRHSRVVAYDFAGHVIPGENGPYWRDVGRLGEYLAANTDLAGVHPALNLYNTQWPIMSVSDGEPGAKVVPLPDDVSYTKPGWRHRPNGYIVAGGCTFDWPVNLNRVVIGQRVHIGRFAEIGDSVIHCNASIGRDVRLERAIVMAGAHVPDGATVGFDAERDSARGLHVYENERVVIVPPTASF